MGDLEFSFNSFPQEVHFVDRHCEFGAYFAVFLWSKYSILIFTQAISIKTVFESKTMSNLKLFPSHDPCSSDLVGLNSESAIFIVKHMGFLCKYSW